MPRKDVKFNSHDATLLDDQTAQATKSQAPSQRFQVDQGTGSAMSESMNTTAGGNEFKYKKSKSKGAPLKTSVISEVITQDRGFSGAAAQQATALSRSGFKSLAYSGDAGTILGNPASTPVVGTQDRASSRSGKILDATNKKINYLASEQVLVEYDQPAPLSSQPDGIGYNGTPMNSVARGQKSYGSNPGDLLFDRSVDEISRSVGLFVHGQAIGEQGIEYGDAPSKTLTAPDYITEKDTDAYAVGNFMPDYIEIEFKKDAGRAYLAKFVPHTIDASINSCPSDVVNDGAQNRLIDLNNAEIVRQDMDVKAGRETAENWSPLPRAVQQPTATVGYLHDLEAEMGAMVYASMRAFSKTHSYQLNKAAKDGQRVVDPIMEMFYRPFTGAVSSKQFANFGSVSEILKHVELKNLPTADKMIGVFDSAPKYATKADILTQPRSLKMHYSTARSNSGMFRLKPEFVAWMDRQDFFSTIDHEYDPLSPVYITDGFKYVTRHDWAKQFAFTRSSYGGPRKYSTDAFAYSYIDRMSLYNVIMGNPTLSAIAYFLEQHAQRFADYFTDVVRIPVVSSGKCFSLWDMLVMASTPYMQYERSQCFKDVLDFERNFEYPYKDLVKLSDVIDAPRKHYGFSDISEPLVTKQINTVDVLTWTMPAIYSFAGVATENSNADMLYIPHYFSEEQFEFTATHAGSMKKGFKHTLKPVIRSGVKYGLVDQFYQWDDMDAYLVYDPEVVPTTMLEVGDNNQLLIMDGFAEGYVSKRSQNTAGRVLLESFGAGLRHIVGTPRVLGWYFILPAAAASTASYIGAVGSDLEYKWETPEVSRSVVYGECIGGALTAYSYVATAYTNDSALAAPDALSHGVMAVGRGQNFAQQWFEYRALKSYGTATYEGVAAIVPALSLNIYEGTPSADANGITAPRIGTYVLDGANNAGSPESVIDAFTTVESFLADKYWTRLQRLQFIVNPFAMACSTREAPKDPLELVRLFNMAEFMDLDFSVANNDRIYNIQEQGWLFVQDPWMSKFKD